MKYSLVGTVGNAEKYVVISSVIRRRDENIDFNSPS